MDRLQARRTGQYLQRQGYAEGETGRLRPIIQHQRLAERRMGENQAVDIEL